MQGKYASKVKPLLLGLLAELGIWTVQKLIEHKKIMLLHNILTSKDGRLVKEIVEDQIKISWPGCWTENVRQIGDKYNISIVNIKEYTKDKLKKLMKEKINKSMDVRIKELSQQKTKLRFIKEHSQKEYLHQLNFKQTVMMLKIRLNMVETKCNYKGLFKDNLKCNICKTADDTTEHLIQCTNNIPTWNIQEHITKPENRIVSIVKQNISKRKALGFKVTVCIGED